MEKETDIQNVNDQKSSLKVILRYTLTEALFFLNWRALCPYHH